MRRCDAGPLLLRDVEAGPMIDVTRLSDFEAVADHGLDLWLIVARCHPDNRRMVVARCDDGDMARAIAAAMNTERARRSAVTTGSGGTGGWQPT